jgi:hypothetical protein
MLFSSSAKVSKDRNGVGQAASASNVYHAGNGSSLENDKSLDSLLSPVKEGGYIPHQLKKPKRKKQKGFSMGF